VKERGNVLEQVKRRKHKEGGFRRLNKESYQKGRDYLLGSRTGEDKRDTHWKFSSGEEKTKSER